MSAFEVSLEPPLYPEGYDRAYIQVGYNGARGRFAFEFAPEERDEFVKALQDLDLTGPMPKYTGDPNERPGGSIPLTRLRRSTGGRS